MSGDWKTVAGDFNGDGLSDVAAEETYTNRVQILLNHGGALVASGTEYPVGPDTRDLVAVDLNVDGFSDLVTLNTGDQTLSVLISRGDGTFRPAVTYLSCAGAEGSLKAGDFNGDGIPDVVCAGGFFMAGIGDGGLLPGAPISGSLYGSMVAVGDFNGDKALDLALAYESILVEPGTGNGGFAPGVEYSLPAQRGVDLVSGDFDGDGFIDLGYQSGSWDPPTWSGQGVSFFRGVGDGTFRPQIRIPLGDGTQWLGPGRMAVADLAGAGRDSLIASSNSSLNVLTFGPEGPALVPLIPGEEIFWPSVGDFNGDHAVDIAVATHGAFNEHQLAMVVYLNGCP